MHEVIVVEIIAFMQIFGEISTRTLLSAMAKIIKTMDWQCHGYFYILSFSLST